MTRPLYIDATVYQYLDPDRYRLLETYHRADQFFWTGTLFVGSPRYGSHKHWNFSDKDLAGGTPDLTRPSTKTLKDIHDQRAQELANLMQESQQRLAVFWSGGIDSTSVLAAIVKNFPPYLLSQVDVLCNNCSYLENPYFYERVVKNRLNIINVNSIDCQGIQDLIKHSLVTDGEPADKLWLVEVGLSYLQRHGVQGLQQTLERGKDTFLSFLSLFMTPMQSQHYWEHVEQNLREVNAPVENIADLFWWINFNYHWKGHLMGFYARHQDKHSEAWQKCQENYHPWYCTSDFQTWSFSPVSQQRSLITCMAEYKMEAKRYIYELDRNEFYLRYKTKLDSARRGASKPGGLVIFDDGSCITAAEQLPEFIQQHCLI